ncbi:Cytochrome P450 [Streptoalloteichus tenebrarius]|uniref:Cytochrome P450 n=1 Tax=Streptoalloteichus tenebrarius (strain ATCC 17920 / DSM 40477 / JCM 4838 / CBS 697.72 / NBRC 16177 / NCIMB 11028 / NRRL B-12390 / A12253. 1 / ISP 5477) TaxID=1933 RepID=A0ABT1HQS6_STRSD|nr:cytochrome P450 [Streptoalloteichus tenebrarius]MCP2257871.1 Cytochrome P450 [Streptoalloteichus tenebrarius]BFE99766.1 cytochrome P450 [Streptoalloteichus tenebrarius]
MPGARLRATLSLLTTRTVLRAHSLLGDPLARVISPDGGPLLDAYRRVRLGGPLVRSRLGAWATARHSVASQILRDPRFGVVPFAGDSRALLPQPKVGGGTLVHPINDSFLSLDPPRHTRLRRLVAPWFTPRALRARTDRVEAIVRRRLDELDTARPVDLMADFATAVPVEVICDLLGVPTPEHARFATWGEVLAGTLDGLFTVREMDRLHATMVEMDAFFRELMDFRRRHPGEDVVSEVVRSTGPDDDVTTEDLLATTELLLVAGFETTVNLIGNGVLALLSHPDALRRFLADPGLAENLVEEVLRHDSPVQFTGRIVREDMVFEGARLRRDEPVLVLLSGANRDPAVFDDPERFDIARANAREHLSFSGGVHYCLGAGLARLEGAVALRELFQRFPRLELAGEPLPRPTRLIHGVRTLPVRCHAPADVLTPPSPSTP